MRVSKFTSAALIPITLACSEYDTGDVKQSSRDTQAETSDALACGPRERRVLRVETFNAALAPNLAPLVTERTPAVISALSEQAEQLDVLCVQEFWQDADFSELATQIHRKLPYALRRAPRPGTGSCTMDELASLGQCLATSCANSSAADQALCAQSQCATTLQSLSGGCLGCILDNIGSDFAMCAGAAGPGDPAIYGGTYDVGLLTRNKVLESDISKELDSYFVRMAVLYAKLEVAGGSPVYVFCAHLGSSLGVIPYAGKYSSWQDEHLHQVLQLRDYIRQKAGNSGRVVVLGDMNTSPDGRGLVGELPDDYAALVGSDLDDVYYDQRDMDCTWCPENTLVDDNSSPHLDDHVLVRGLRGRARVTRVLDEPIDLMVSGQILSTNLSDHYGLRGTIPTVDAREIEAQ